MPGPLFTSMNMHHNRLIVVAATLKPHVQTIYLLPNTLSFGNISPAESKNPFTAIKPSTSPIPKSPETIVGIPEIADGVHILQNGIPAFKHPNYPSPPSLCDVERVMVAKQSPISETKAFSNVWKSTDRGNATPFIKLLPMTPKKIELEPCILDDKKVHSNQKVIPYDQEALKSIQQAVQSLQVAVLSLTEAVTAVKEAVKSVRQNSPSTHLVAPATNSSVTVSPEREGIKMVKETQVTTTTSSNVVSQAPTECHPAETSQERLPGKHRKGRKKLDKHRNRKNQLQNNGVQDKDHLDDVSASMAPSLQSSKTVDDNGGEIRAQIKSIEESVEPEVQRGPRKSRGKGRKKEQTVGREREEVDTSYDITAEGDACPQKENSSSQAVVASNNGEAPDNASALPQPVLPKQRHRKNKGKGQRKGKRCDQHSSQVQYQVRKRGAGVPVPVGQTHALHGESEQGTRMQQGLSDRTNQLPATPHGKSRKLESNCPPRTVSPESRRPIQNDLNGMNRNQSTSTALQPAANRQMGSNAVGTGASASGVNGDSIQSASRPFSPPRTQISASSQDFRNGIELPVRTKKRWKPRHRMNRAG